jgi:Pyridoxamine 5'-phosphate oxidase
MAKLYDHITDHLAEFIRAQPMFFVASAPLAADGHVNVSPKGLDCLRILSPQRVAYLDLTGSGNETSAHLHENRRITFMFCAFNRPPSILRLYGQGYTILPGSEEWEQLKPLFPDYSGARQIIAADIDRVQTSCGYAVPLMDYVGQRDTLLRWANTKGDQELEEYRCEKNVRSIDGLPTPLAEQLQDQPGAG